MLKTSLMRAGKLESIIGQTRAFGQKASLSPSAASHRIGLLGPVNG